MRLNIDNIEVLLLIAAVVAMLVRRARLPYTVGLVVTGIVLALTRYAPDVSLTRDLIFFAFLPPLIYEAAIRIHWPELRSNLLVVTVMATVGVLLSAAVTTTGMRWLAGWPWEVALLFGVLIAATDPVSVIATFKEIGIKGRLRLLIEAESLFNDGTAAVLFTVALIFVQSGALEPGDIARRFLLMTFGGLLCGAVVGLAMLLLAGQAEDHLVEVTFTTVAAYGSFLLAEHFHLSGVLATLAAGLILGNQKLPGVLTERGREAVELFWDYAAFVANSLIFLLLGIQEARMQFAAIWLPSVTAIGLVLLGRMASVYGCCALFAPTRQRVAWREQHMLVWGGLRGALALALALGLPRDLPLRGTITTVAFAVVAFSVIVQGLTIPMLLRKLRIL